MWHSLFLYVHLIVIIVIISVIIGAQRSFYKWISLLLLLLLL